MKLFNEGFLQDIWKLRPKKPKIGVHNIPRINLVSWLVREQMKPTNAETKYTTSNRDGNVETKCKTTAL